MLIEPASHLSFDPAASSLAADAPMEVALSPIKRGPDEKKLS